MVEDGVVPDHLKEVELKQLLCPVQSDLATFETFQDVPRVHTA
jgi:hypothetical protein